MPIFLAALSICTVALAIYKIFVPTAPSIPAIMQAILDGSLDKALHCVTELEAYHGKNAETVFTKDTSKLAYFMYDLLILKLIILYSSSLHKMDKKPLQKKEYDALLLKIQKIVDKKPHVLPADYLACLEYAQRPHATPHGLKIKKMKNPELHVYKFFVVRGPVNNKVVWKLVKDTQNALAHSKGIATAPLFVQLDLKRFQDCRTMDERNALENSLNRQDLASLDTLIYA